MPIGAYYPRRNESVDTLPRGLSYYPQHIIAQAEDQKVVKANQRVQSSTVAESSDSASSVSAPELICTSPPVVSQMQQHRTTQSPTICDTSRPVIQDFRPPQQQQQQSVSAPSVPNIDIHIQTQKRVTRSSTAAANGITNGTSISQTSSNTTNTRHKKSASKGLTGQRHSQQQSQTQAATVVNSNVVTPTTFAGIMKAYPAPSSTSTKVAYNSTHTMGS